MPNFGPGGGVFDRPGTMTGRPKALRRTEKNNPPTSTIVPWKRTGARPGGGVFGRPGTMTGRPKALRRTEEMIT